MNLAGIVLGAAFSALGMWLAFGNCYEHIPAWKAMSEEERGKVNIRPLCRNVGVVIMLCGIIFLIKGIWQAEWFVYAMIGWFIIAGLDLWYISKSRRYTKKMTGGDNNGKEK